MRRIISGIIVFIMSLSLCACSSDSAINNQIAELERDLVELAEMKDETEWYIDYGDEARRDMYETKLKAIKLNIDIKERKIEELKDELR